MSYANASYDHRYAGTILIDGRDVAITRQCVHCGDHFVSVRGSGATRGWCTRCNGIVCGPKCAACVPFEQQLLAMEGKLDLDALPITVAVPRSVGD